MFKSIFVFRTLTPNSGIYVKINYLSMIGVSSFSNGGPSSFKIFSVNDGILQSNVVPSSLTMRKLPLKIIKKFVKSLFTKRSAKNSWNHFSQTDLQKIREITFHKQICKKFVKSLITKQIAKNSWNHFTNKKNLQKSAIWWDNALFVRIKINTFFKVFQKERPWRC